MDRAYVDKSFNGQSWCVRWHSSFVTLTAARVSPQGEVWWRQAEQRAVGARRAMCRFRYRENTVKKVPMVERDDTYQAIRGALACSPRCTVCVGTA